MRRAKPLLPLAWAAMVAGCAARVEPPPVVATLPPRPALPAGATPGMAVPARAADGSFPSPNRGLSAAGTLWHLRSGLNVAALACRGGAEPALVAGYNAWLRSDAAALAQAEAGLAAEYRATGGPGWRARYDGDMTRLYNYWAQGPARPGLCAAAQAVVAELPGTAGADLAAAAPGWLARLYRPVTDFYAAYDDWRVGAGEPPRLELDPAVFR